MTLTTKTAINPIILISFQTLTKLQLKKKSSTTVKNTTKLQANKTCGADENARKLNIRY